MASAEAGISIVTGAQYFPPTSGARFYLVYIRITNNGDSAIPGRWKLKFAFTEDRTIVSNPGYVVSPRVGRDMTVTEGRGLGINPHGTARLFIYTYGWDTSSFTPPTPSPSTEPPA